jgi:hypothetical protein
VKRRQTVRLSSEPWSDFAPDAAEDALCGVPVVDTDWMTPWALVTVVVTVPSLLSTEVVVVALLLELLDEPLEAAPAAADGADELEGVERDAPTLLIALMPLMAFRLDDPPPLRIAP